MTRKAPASGMKKLADIRRQIAELETERQRVLKALRSEAEIREAIADWRERWAAQFDPTLTDFLVHGTRPTINVLLGRIHESDRSVLMAALAAIFPNEVEAAVLERALAAAEGCKQMSLEERDRRVAEIDAEIEALGHAEEELVRLLEAEGLYVARRGDADSAIVLGFRGGDEAA